MEPNISAPNCCTATLQHSPQFWRHPLHEVDNLLTRQAPNPSRRTGSERCSAGRAEPGQPQARGGGGPRAIVFRLRVGERSAANAGGDQ